MSDLAGVERCTSSYVRCQYKTLILNSFILLHTVVEQSGTLDEAAKRMTALKSAVNDLAYEVGIKLFATCSKKEQLLLRLERLIELDWYNLFRAAVQRELAGATGCTLADDAPKRRDRFYWSIDRCAGKCDVAGFWKRMQTDLEVLASLDVSQYNAVTDPKQTMRAVTAQARRIIAGASPYGKACRETMDDAIIAIEARENCPGDTVHTLDRDFDLLGPLLHVAVRVLR